MSLMMFGALLLYAASIGLSIAFWQMEPDEAGLSDSVFVAAASTGIAASTLVLLCIVCRAFGIGVM